MHKFKALYKGMYDDLKDAEMMMEYACEIKKHHPEDKAVADELVKYAKHRLDHLMDFHKIFVDESKKMKEFTEKTVSQCMWYETHEQLQEWYDEISKKIIKYE